MPRFTAIEWINEFRGKYKVEVRIRNMNEDKHWLSPLNAEVTKEFALELANDEDLFVSPIKAGKDVLLLKIFDRRGFSDDDRERLDTKKVIYDLGPHYNTLWG